MPVLEWNHAHTHTHTHTHTLRPDAQIATYILCFYGRESIHKGFVNWLCWGFFLIFSLNADFVLRVGVATPSQKQK